jgi:hypothetical protein
MRARHLYATLCVIGLALPNAAFWPWLTTHGIAPRRFLADLLANGVSTFFGLDVVLSACVLILFVETEGRRLGLRRRWAPIAAACLVGVSFGLPLFLYQRQVHLDRAATRRMVR